MKVYIITDVDLNVPGAVVSRLLSYSRGLAEHGVTVISCWLGNERTVSDKFVTQYPGLNFWFGQSSPAKVRGPLRMVRTYSAARELARYINEKHNPKDSTAIIYYGMLIPERMPIQDICDRLNIPTFDEITEFPYLARKNRILRRIQYQVYMDRYLPRNHAVLCISGAIRSFIDEHLKRFKSRTVTHLYGIMVEADRFAPENAPAKLHTDPERYIAYCGTMYGDKDGIPDLIRAFAHARKTFSDLKLVLIGDNSDRQRLENVFNLIDLLSLRNDVIFTGRIDFPDMHRLLCGAAALVLSKPDNVQNQGAFPTKLGEYLACGRPVITTKVGDIPLFLTDGETAFLAPGSDPEAFSGKISECLLNESLASEVARKGRRLAETVFNYRLKAQELKSYLFDEKR